MIKGTEEQEQIWNEIVNTTNDVIVNAGAGTGKTFTIVEGANRANEVKYANCSANKSKKILGYKKIKNINESLDDIIKYIKKRGVKEFSYDYNLEIFNDKTPDTWKKKIF